MNHGKNICNKTSVPNISYPQAGFRCFVDRKLVFWKAVLRRKYRETPGLRVASYVELNQSVIFS